MSPMFRRCEDCGGERLFGQPHEMPGSCPDSPDGQCPEWLCTECGGGLLATCPASPAELTRVPAAVGRVA